MLALPLAAREACAPHRLPPRALHALRRAHRALLPRVSHLLDGNEGGGVHGRPARRCDAHPARHAPPDAGHDPQRQGSTRVGRARARAHGARHHRVWPHHAASARGVGRGRAALSRVLREARTEPQRWQLAVAVAPLLGVCDAQLVTRPARAKGGRSGLLPCAKLGRGGLHGAAGGSGGGRRRRRAVRRSAGDCAREAQGGRQVETERAAERRRVHRVPLAPGPVDGSARDSLHAADARGRQGGEGREGREGRRQGGGGQGRREARAGDRFPPASRRAATARRRRPRLRRQGEQSQRQERVGQGRAAAHLQPRRHCLLGLG
mmetsp:Transcript_64605/g.193023  ORF Transcript_64605/g.193023 Transcript_64605/m.193023 type:complete len:321 (+) Transcript_64605:266-1228(+)